MSTLERPPQDPILNAYRQVVDELFQAQSHYIIANGSAGHAAVLYAKLFHYAQKEVRIFCHCLNPEVFDQPEVLAAAREFLEAGKTLYIAVQEEPEELTRFLDLILEEDFDEQVFIWKGKEYRGTNGKLLNFAVMDETAYRFEADRDRQEAIASANDPRFAKRLVKAFQEVITNEPLAAEIEAS